MPSLAQLSESHVNGVLVLSHAFVLWVGFIIGRHRGRGALRRRLEQVGSRLANEL